MGNYSDIVGKISFNETSKVGDIENFLKNHKGIEIFKDDYYHNEEMIILPTEINVDISELKAYFLGEEITTIVEFLKSINVENISVDIIRYGDMRGDIEHYSLINNQVVSAKAEIRKAFHNYNKQYSSLK